ncbi:MAG: nucleotidyltransferase family protein [Elainellaceae cyanobacterium]
MVEQRHIDYWRQRQRQQQERNRRLAQRALADSEAIAALLQRDFGATRVILFGSLAKQRFTAASDIDIAAAGIPPEQYFKALGAANHLSQWWVDLKPWEALEPHFQTRVVSTGKVLYEAADPQ